MVDMTRQSAVTRSAQHDKNHTALTEYQNYKLQALANNSSMVRNGSAVQMICVSGALLMCMLLALIYAFIQNFFIFRFDEIISFRFVSFRLVLFSFFCRFKSIKNWKHFTVLPFSFQFTQNEFFAFKRTSFIES